jgi:hypothetical protein
MSKYLGIPQEEWDSLAAQAEDTMLTKGLGQHILGTYPAGPRIYGKAEAEPKLLVITVDAPSQYLNPLITPRELIIDGSSLWFTDLYSWISSLKIGKPIPLLTHIIPLLGPAHYEDSQLTEIHYLAESYLRARNWDNRKYAPTVTWHDALYLRARWILATTGRLAPCLNKQWDTVESVPQLPKRHKKADSWLTQYVTEDLAPDRRQEASLLRYCDWLAESLSTAKYLWKEAEKEEEKLGEAVKRFYTRLM